MGPKIYKIYVFIDDKGLPYYIGMTKDFKTRKKAHLMKIRSGNKLPKYNKARKLIRNGFPFTMSIIEQKLTEKQAIKKEKYYIIFYKKQGIRILNLTEGGEGGDTFTNNPNKEKMLRRFNFLGKKHTEESKRLIAINNPKIWLGKKQPKYIGIKKSLKLKGRKDTRNFKQSEHAKRLISKNNARYWLGKSLPESALIKIRKKRKYQDMSCNRCAVHYLITPNNKKYTVRYVSGFLKKFKIPKTQFYRLIRGRKKIYKGWRINHAYHK